MLVVNLDQATCVTGAKSVFVLGLLPLNVHCETRRSSQHPATGTALLCLAYAQRDRSCLRGFIVPAVEGGVDRTMGYYVRIWVPFPALAFV